MSGLDLTDPRALRHHFWGHPIQPDWAEILQELADKGLLLEREDAQRDHLAKRLQAVGDVAAVRLAKAGDLSFTTVEETARAAIVRGVSALVVPACLAEKIRDDFDPLLIISETPKVAFAIIMSAMYPTAVLGGTVHLEFAQEGQTGPNIALTASVSKTAILGKDVWIGPGASVGPGAILGAGCTIGSNALIGSGVILGESCQVGAGAVIWATIAGSDCQIRSNAVLGERGFGVSLYPNAKDHHGHCHVYNIPQISGVRLGNRVEVRHQAVIDRGALSDTILGDDVRIDSHSTIGHGVCIGNRVSVGAYGALGGQARIENDCILWARVGVEQGRCLGPAIQVKYGSFVTKNFTEKGIVLKGYPAMRERDWNKQQAWVRGQLPRRKKHIDS